VGSLWAAIFVPTFLDLPHLLPWPTALSLAVGNARAPLARHRPLCSHHPLLAAGRQANLRLGEDHRTDHGRHPRPGTPPHPIERYLGGLRHGCVATGAGCPPPELVLSPALSEVEGIVEGRRVRDLFRPGGVGRGPVQRGQVRPTVSYLYEAGAGPEPALRHLGQAADAKGIMSRFKTGGLLGSLILENVGGELNG
jgi:hypothetical protein